MSKSKTNAKIVIVFTSDYEGLYVDGALAAENDSFPVPALLRVLEDEGVDPATISLAYQDMDGHEEFSAQVARTGGFPALLSEVPRV